MVDNVDAGIEAFLGFAKKSQGSKVCLGSELFEKNFGLPNDYLALRWITDGTVFPMGKVIGCAGQKESCKSAFAMFMASLYVSIGGCIVYIDTEKKKSAVLYEAIVGKEGLARTLEYRSSSTEEWQSQVNEAMEYADQAFGGNVPLLFIIDSLGGVNVEEETQNIAKDGYSKARNTTGMVKAKSHNSWFRDISGRIDGKPVTVMYVNHLSDDMDSPIKGQKRKPGGTGQDYFAVLDMWFSVVKSVPVYKPSFGYTERKLKIAMKKNSVGASQRAIEVPYRWANDPESGRLSRVWFDWDGALAKVLCENAEVVSRLKGVISITSNNNKYSCKELGLVGVQDSELGAAIRENVELREKISDKLGISRYVLWDKLQIDDETRKIYEEYNHAPEPTTDAKVQVVSEE